MNKFVKYGVVAGLTMASFSLAGMPLASVYADGVATYECGGTVDAANAKVVIAKDATECVLKYTFQNGITNVNSDDRNTAAGGAGNNNNAHVVFAGIDMEQGDGDPDAKDYMVDFNVGGKDITVTLTEAGIAKIRAKGTGGVAMTVDDNTQTFTTQLVVDTEIAPVVTEVVIGRKATEYVLNYEFQDLITNVNDTSNTPDANHVLISFDDGAGLELGDEESDVKDYLIGFAGMNQSKKVTVTLTESGIAKIRAKGENGVTITVKNDTEIFITKITVEVKVDLESVEATITDDKIGTSYNEGYEGEPELSYEVEAGYKDIVTVDENGKITVKEGYLTARDEWVTITVTATDDGKTVTTTVRYKIAANYTRIEAGFGAEMTESTEIEANGNAKVETKAVKNVKYTYECEGEICDYIEIDANGNISVKAGYVAYDDKSVKIIVRGWYAVDGSVIGPELISEKELTLTVKANFTMSATFEDDADEKTTTVSQGAKIKTPEVDGVRYEYTCEGSWVCSYVTIDENGNIVIDPSYTNADDATVTIIVKAFAGEVELGTKELTLVIKANYRYVKAEVTKGDSQEYEAGSKDLPSFTLDTGAEWVETMTLYSRTLAERYSKLAEEGLTHEELKAKFTEFEWSLLWGLELVKGEDFTVDENGNIVLSAALMAKLANGDYRASAYYYDTNDEDDKVSYGAEMYFTVTGVETPDTGAATAVKAGATTSIFATVMAAITAAGAAIVAKFAKRK